LNLTDNVYQPCRVNTLTKKRQESAKHSRNASTKSEKPRYRAPALEKGLDILELLASESRPLSSSEIVQQLGRSTGELFRMIQVLEYRGFIEQALGSEGYRQKQSLGAWRDSNRFAMSLTIPLPAAALQFPLLHPGVASVIPGAASPALIRRNVELYQVRIPMEFWQTLRSRGLISESAPRQRPEQHLCAT
jgi:hypothetical protein